VELDVPPHHIRRPADIPDHAVDDRHDSRDLRPVAIRKSSGTGAVFLHVHEKERLENPRTSPAR
jgi:hypothetical protein